MPLDPEELRVAMRHWATGVTIVATRHAGVIHGMTVNAFTSVSLTPPLIVVSIESIVRTHALIQQSGVFAVTMLKDGQAWVSDRFAGRDTEHEDRFEGLRTVTAVTGAPILAENIGYLDCVVRQAYPAGDHTLFIAEVVAASSGPAGGHNGARPLLYFDQDYRQMC